MVVKTKANINTLSKNRSHKFISSPKHDILFDLSLFINNSEETFLVVNKEYEVIICNDIVIAETKKYLGVDLEVGMSMFTMVEEHDKERIKGICDKAFEGIKTEFEYSLDPPVGEKQHFYISYKPARNIDKEIIGAIIIAQNITEKKKALDAVAESEQRWRFALEGSNQGVWDWNIKTNEIYFSPSWRKMLGYEGHEIKDSFSEWENLLHPDDKKKCGSILLNTWALTTLFMKPSKG